MQHKGRSATFSNHITEINCKLFSLKAIDYTLRALINNRLKVVYSALYVMLASKVMTISKTVFLGFEKVLIRLH